MAELGLWNPPVQLMNNWFLGAGRYAASQGFAAGMPTGHVANYGQGPVCGVLLFPAGTAEWRDIPATELGMDSGLPPGSTTDIPKPPPPPPKDPPPPSDILVVHLQPVQMMMGFQGYQTAVTTNPAVWTQHDAVITGVRSMFGEEFSLAHRDKAGRQSGSIVLPRADLSGVGPWVSSFNMEFVEGDWSASVPTGPNGIVLGNVSFEIKWES